MQRTDDVSPEEALRQALIGATGLWKSHRPAMRAIHEHWNTTPELRALWLGVVERFTDAIAAEIDHRERATQALAPGGAGSRQIAAALAVGHRALPVRSRPRGSTPDLPDLREPMDARTARSRPVGRRAVRGARGAGSRRRRAPT